MGEYIFVGFGFLSFSNVFKNLKIYEPCCIHNIFTTNSKNKFLPVVEKEILLMGQIRINHNLPFKIYCEIIVVILWT